MPERKVDTQDSRPLVRAFDAARGALGAERFEEIVEPWVLGSFELKFVAPVLVDKENSPVRHVSPDLELHVVGVPSRVLNARAPSITIRDDRRRKDPVWDNLHFGTDRDAEWLQCRPRVTRAKAEIGEALVNDCVAVEGGRVAGDLDHRLRLLKIKLSPVRLPRYDLANLCRQIDGSVVVGTDVDEREIRVAVDGDIVLC